MQSKFDIPTILSAIGVAAYTAVAIGYVARQELGFSFGEIRAVAMVIAIAIATLISIDFFGKNLGRPN